MPSTPQDFTAGQVLTDTMMDKLPQGVLDKQSTTTGPGPTSGTTELTLHTATALTPAQSNRRWRITLNLRGISGTISNDVFLLRVKESTTVLMDYVVIIATTGTTIAAGPVVAYVDGVGVSAHTYTATLVRSSGTGTATVSAGSTNPMTLVVEDVGST